MVIYRYGHRNEMNVVRCSSRVKMARTYAMTLTVDMVAIMIQLQ